MAISPILNSLESGPQRFSEKLPAIQESRSNSTTPGPIPFASLKSNTSQRLTLLTNTWQQAATS